MKSILLFLSNLVVASIISQTTFQKSYSSDVGSQGFFVLPLNDGYMIIGQGSNSDNDGYSGISFLKINQEGDTLWTNLISAGSIGLITTCANITSDGGYIVGGITSDQPIQYIDAFLLKADANGNLQWLKTYGDGYDDRIYSVQEMSNGNILVAGSNSGSLLGYDSFLVMELNSGGEIVVKKTYSIGTNNEALSIIQTEDGFAVCGSASDFGSGSWDTYIIRSSSSTDLDFKRVFGGASEDRGMDMQRASDGGFIVTGFTNSFTQYYNVSLMKIDAAGEVEWCKIYSGTGVSQGTRVKITSDGGYIIAGQVNIAAQTDAILVRTDSEGVLQWARKYGNSDGDLFNNVAQTSDGGFVATGYYSDRTYVVKTDADGVSGCFESPLDLTEEVVLINATIGGVAFDPLYATPEVPADNYAYAPQVVDMCLTIGLEETASAVTSVYPNPIGNMGFTIETNNDFIGGKLEVLNSTGQILFAKIITANRIQIYKNYASGLYMLRLTSPMGMVEVHSVVQE